MKLSVSAPPCLRHQVVKPCFSSQGSWKAFPAAYLHHSKSTSQKDQNHQNISKSFLMLLIYSGMTWQLSQSCDWNSPTLSTLYTLHQPKASSLAVARFPKVSQAPLMPQPMAGQPRWKGSCSAKAKTIKKHQKPNWGWVKTLVPSEPQNSWDLWMFIPLKMYL